MVGSLCICDAAVCCRLIQMEDSFFLGLFYNNHVVMVIKFDAVIVQGVHLFVFLCGM